MAYTVKIKYEPPVAPVDDRAGDPICPVIVPESSYVDSDVYVNGHEEDYGKSVYATNVEGNGTIERPAPFDATHIPMSSPLAQFNLATVLEEKGTLKDGVEFTVEDYKEAFYYKTLGEQLKDQGFTVEVKKS